MILMEILRRSNSHGSHGIHVYRPPQMKSKYIIKANANINDFIICLFILSTLSIEYLSYVR